MIESKRKYLHEAIDEYGINYEKIIEIDSDLHEDIIKKQRELLKEANKCN